MAFDTKSNPNSEGARRALMDAIAACDAAKGKLMAALAMRASPALALTATTEAAEQVGQQMRKIGEATVHLSGGAS